jgi:hypothetical protein
MAKNYALITDLPEHAETVSSIKLLFEGIKIYQADYQIEAGKIFEAKDGIVVLLADSSKVKKWGKTICQYTAKGGTVFMDMRGFAVLNGLQTKLVRNNRIIVAQESRVTSGYKKGEPVLYGPQKQLIGLEKSAKLSRKKIIVLGESGDKDVVLVEQERKTGKIVAVDIMSLQEPQYEKTTENKYLFLVNTLGNSVKYGSYYAQRLSYQELVDLMKELANAHPGTLDIKKEGRASGGYDMFSLNAGNPSGQEILIFSATHGNEWETVYGVINFIKYIAEHEDQNIINLDKYHLKAIPVLNPFGFQNKTRQNGNKVDLNRNGDYFWEVFIGVDKQDYKIGSYDWKGSCPYSEPEMQILRQITLSGNFLAMLDIHGNPSGTGYNKWMGVGNTIRTDAFDKGEHFKNLFNERIKGRYVMKQRHEKIVKPFLIEKVTSEKRKPTIINSLSGDNYGYLVEVLCGYSSTAFIVMQSDITCELCAAFCKALAP